MNGRHRTGRPRRRPGLPAEGLRERKKRLMRQQLSDTATAMFLERGFDGVRVAEVAAACGVSEKTVFNYFPVKEALVMDRLEATLAALRAGLADPGAHAGPGGAGGPRPGAGRHDRAARRQEDARPGPRGGPAVRRPDPRHALAARLPGRHDRPGRLAAAEVLAARTGTTADDPEPQIAARALLGLWRVQADSLRRHLDVAPTPTLLCELVTADVRRAARLLDTGLRTFAAPGSRRQPSG